jgi:hypothetical protein
MPLPKFTSKVRRGMWLIVARSPTVMMAEESDVGFDKEDREAVLAASRYAEAHWHPDPVEKHLVD